MTINGKHVNYFCGTSYYALHGNPQVIAAACRATEEFGLGPGTIAGVEIYDELEALAKDYFGVEAVTYMASGYLSISILLQALHDEFDVIFVDSASHYCVYDSLRSYQKITFKFNHRDSEDLAAKLSQHVGNNQRPVIITDGIFPSSGSLAPLDKYSEIMKLYPGAILCVDDSHGVGVIGPNGRGTLDHFGLHGPPYFLAGTLSKAFGGFGGIVPSSTILGEKIALNVKLMVGASRPPIPAAAAACMGLRLLSEQPPLRKILRRNVNHMRQGLAKIGLAIDDSPVPIVSVKASSDLSKVNKQLESRDIFVHYVPASGYSDAPDYETLRIAVFSTHSIEQIDYLVASLGELL
jgi:glycine C-acetyltransferase/8-amino-7-oxononanoate synthase